MILSWKLLISKNYMRKGGEISLYSFYDPLGKKEYLVQAEIDFTHSVNGEKSISGTVELDSSVIDKIDKRWSLVFQNEKYVITMTHREDDSETIILEFEAIHEFFDVFNKSVIDTSTTGSHPYKWYLDQLFTDTGYSYLLYVDVEALDKENWGMDTKMSLFADIINAGDVEYEVIDKVVHIYDKIGSDLSTIVRKGFNLQDFGVEADFSNFITYMKGYGGYFDENDQSKGRLTVEYTSPLAEQYGILAGKPYSNENFTIKENLEAKIKEQVDNSLSVSLSLTVEDLQEAGYPYAMPKCGDYITVINELMNFQQKVRIISVKSSYDIDNTRISIDVTCGSLNMADKNEATDISNGNAIDDIINGTGKIPPSWLTDFIVSASNAINAARTQVIFNEQGIISQSKNDANKLTVLNSEGFGISKDGGKTYIEAITSLGINATAIVTGVLKAIDIEGVNITGSKIQADEFSAIVDNMVPDPSSGGWIKQGEGAFTVNGDNLSFELRNKSGTRIGALIMDYGGYYIMDNQNRQVGGVSDEVVTSHAISVPPYDRHGWGLAGLYVGVDTSNGGELRVVDKKWLPNSGADPNNYTYGRVRASSFVQHSSEKAKENIKPIENAEIYRTPALDIVEETPLFEYQYKGDENKLIGFIAEQSPRGILSEEGKAVDLYKTVAYLWKAVQELQAELKEVKANASRN